ncbi:MAG: FAD-dependent oxidoreductase, partial [Pseudomonadota bacterium]
NRLRFALDTLRRLREAVGDATLGIRISADEFLPGGLALVDMTRIVAKLAEAVRIDFVNVSHSAYHGSETISTQIADMSFARDAFRHFAPAIKGALAHMPAPPAVFAVCKYRSLAEAEETLSEGGADMVGMARAHIAEPALVKKTIAGREAEIRPCINCNQGCTGYLALNLPITCLTNPRVGLEAAPVQAHANGDGLRVVVVGGGPAGMEAAAVAAGRGHQVELWEAGDGLGGALTSVSSMPLRSDFAMLLDYQKAALERAGVTVRTNARADAALLAEAGPDAILIATGAEPRARSLERGEALTLEAAIKGEESLGEHVVLEDRLGTWSVVSVAEWLADKGHRVTLLAPTGTPGWTIPVYSSFALRARLKDKGVAIRSLHTVAAFDGGAAELIDLSTDARLTLCGVDAVVAPAHGVPRDHLFADLAPAF